MKILMINVVCGIYSTGRICTDLAEELEQQGDTVRIAYGREKVPAQYQKYAVRIGSDFSIKIDVLKSRLFDTAGFNSKRQTEKFIDWIRTFDPDMIHLQNLHGYFINIEVLINYLKNEYSKQKGHGIIWTMHDCWPFSGHSALCDGAGCMKWKIGCGECPQIKEYPKSYTDHSSRNWRIKKELLQDIPNLTIVTPSRWLARCVKKSFLKEYEVKIIPNGIDTDIFYPRSEEEQKKLRNIYHIENKKILLAAATTWTVLKGFKDYITLSRKLDENFIIVLIGVNEKQKKLLPKNVIGLNRTSDQNEMAVWYSAADAYLNLTYCDTYPTVNMESVACGTPVITYDTGGSLEAMFGYGIIAEKGNLEQILQAVLNHKHIKRRYYNQNTPDAEIRRFDKEESIKKYIELYKS